MKLVDFNSYSKGEGNLQRQQIIIASRKWRKKYGFAADKSWNF
jgi:hypothetical protein